MSFQEKESSSHDENGDLAPPQQQEPNGPTSDDKESEDVRVDEQPQETSKPEERKENITMDPSAMASKVENEHVQQVEEESNDDEEKQADVTASSSRSHGRGYTWMKNHNLGWLARIPSEWPRTIGLIFGVVSTLVYL